MTHPCNSMTRVKKSRLKKEVKHNFIISYRIHKNLFKTFKTSGNLNFSFLQKNFKNQFRVCNTNNWLIDSLIGRRHTDKLIDKFLHTLRTSGVHKLEQCMHRLSGHVGRATDLIQIDHFTDTPVAGVQYLITQPRTVTRHLNINKPTT